MGSFRLWFETEEDKEKVIHRAYDLALEKLLGGDRENLSLSLSRITASGGKDEEGQSNAPSKGWKATLKRLGEVFDLLRTVGEDVEGLDVNGAVQWLEKHGGKAPGDKLTASADFTIYGLLERLFGEERFSKLRDGKELPDSAKAKTPTQPPSEQPSDTSGQPSATAPPAAPEMASAAPGIPAPAVPGMPVAAPPVPPPVQPTM